MKIDYLTIRSRFKNLENTKVDFDENNLMTVVVGNNGSGKSNVLEALVSIFRNLDLGEVPLFSYEIKYKLGSKKDYSERWITIDADPKRGTISTQYKATVIGAEYDKETDVPISKIKRDKSKNYSYFLPNHVFSYYSGPSNRLEKYFIKHRDDYYRSLLYDNVSMRDYIRPLFYAKPYHSQFVLLAFFLNDDKSKEKKFLNNHLGIKGLDSIHFIMRKPDWAKGKDRNDIFWGAKGVVREFLERIFPHCLSPVKITRKEDTTLTGKHSSNEFLHLFLPNEKALHKVTEDLSPAMFFRMLESTLLSEIISEVRIRVKVESSLEPLSFSELSEGEQQLLTVLGLLKFTGNKDALFLLDEPDTHLNPGWAVKYLSFLKEFVPEQQTSHLLMATHHPLTIAELKKEQVQVMWSDSEYNVHAKVPDEHPRGMGYAGILTSDMFGLRGTLDESTENLLRKRREFAEKKLLTSEELEKLKILNQYIENLGFSTAHWDNDYKEYLQLRKKLESNLFDDDSTSLDVLEKRKSKAKEIIQRILKTEQMENDKT